MRNYKDIYEDFERELRNISFSEHAWDMGSDEILDFTTPIEITFEGGPEQVIRAYYDRGNEEVKIETIDTDIFWHRIPKEMQERILDAYEIQDIGETEPLTLEETQSLVYGELCSITDGEYANKIANSIAQDVMADILETADTNFNSSDVRLAIGRALISKLGLSD